MPEFYKDEARDKTGIRDCKYSPSAQLRLDPIARGFRDSVKHRNYLLKGTEHEQTYKDGELVWTEQWDKRDKNNTLSAPFWANVFTEKPCDECNCQLKEGLKSMEIDALFFIRNSRGRTLVIHLEMKMVNERFSDGQAYSYKPRAECYRDQRRKRDMIIPHDDFITVVVCGSETDMETEINGYFDRVITHEEASEVFDNYPSA